MTLIGTKVGNVAILERLGAGGMGDVFEGYDERLKRKVAVKAIRRSKLEQWSAKARFLREARMLSKLNHPNICQIYDHIETDENDYLILELIRGKNLKQAEAEGLSATEKLKIAEQLTSALAAAHEKGIIHRDIKPENVMLTPGGMVKVLDFGLSRSTGTAVHGDDSLDEASHLEPTDPAETMMGEIDPDKTSTQVHTRQGGLLGTLAYMSPEQARRDVATSASDIYSMGILLQEFFTGKPAYGSGLTFPQLLAKTADGETLPIAGLDPDLCELLNRLKSPEPSARPSAADARDRLLWIREKPKRRRQQRLIALAMVFLAVLAVVMTVLAVRIKIEAARANRAAKTAHEVSEFLVSLFGVSDPGISRGNSITARELLDEGAARIEAGLKDQPLTQARLMTTMGVVYQKLGLYDQAIPLLEKGLDKRKDFLNEEDPDLAESMHQLSKLYYILDRYGEALPLAEKAGDIYGRGPLASSPEHAAALANLAQIFWRLDRYDEAVAVAVRALDYRRAGLPPNHPDIADSMNILGSFYNGLGKDRSAYELLRGAVEVWEKSGQDFPDIIRGLNGLANFLVASERFDEAGPLYLRALDIGRRTLGPSHDTIADLNNNLAVLHNAQGNLPLALHHYQIALSIWENSLDPDHTAVALALDNIGMVYLEMGQYELAWDHNQRSLKIWEEALGPESGELPYTLINLAHIAAKQEKWETAKAYYQRALAISEKTEYPDRLAYATNLTELAKWYVSKGRLEEAELFQRIALGYWEKIEGVDNTQKKGLLGEYADILRGLKRDAEAQKVQDRIDSLKDPMEPPGDQF